MHHPAIAMLLLWLVGSSMPVVPTVAPQHGRLNLSAHDFDAAPLVDLGGDWEFYWQQLIPPEVFGQAMPPTPSYFIFPKQWQGSEVGGQHLGAEGSATYRLIIDFPPHIAQFGLKLPYFYGWHRIFINGKLAHQGGHYDGPGRPTRSSGSGFYLFATPVEHRAEIIIHTAVYQSANGGAAESMSLGKVEAVALSQSLALGFDGFIISAIGFMAIYHLALYGMRRRDKSTLLFAVFCLLVATRSLAVGEGKIIHAVFGVSGLWAWRLELITYYLAVPTMTAFVGELYPTETRRWGLWPTVWAAVIGSLVVLVSPSTIFTYTLPPMQLVNIALTVVYLLALLKAVRLGRDGAGLFLIGFSLLAGLSMVEIAALRWHIVIPRVSSVGLYLFIFFQAALLAKRFNDAFRQVETNEARIKKLNHELSEQERARTMFFHNTSHELRTPLHGILAFGKMIRTGAYGEVPARVSANIEKVEMLANSLMVQVNTILDLARSRRGDMKMHHAPIPLNEIVEEATVIGEGLLLKSGGAAFTLTKNWPGSGDDIFIGDREKIITIVRNLLGNAFKFRDPQRANRISADISKASDGSLTITVTDTGIGIAPEHHAAIFEEFRQVQESSRRSYEGTGLGLAMVKNLVDMLHGSVTVQSSLGRGSKFTVRLPAGEASAQAARPSRVSELPAFTGIAASTTTAPPVQSMVAHESVLLAPAAERKNHHILVVDDNHINCEVICDILSLHGYPVQIAHGGRQALERMRDHLPDLVLLDLMMPEVSGEDVVKVMKADPTLTLVPVIILTARASQEDRLWGLSIGADDYLAKPVVAEELLLRVNNTLSRLQLARATAEKRSLELSLAEAQRVHASLGGDGREIPGVKLASYYQSAELAGGDWFGLNYDEKRQRLYLLIGDVSGHDMLSALVTVASAGSFRGAVAMIKDLGDGKSMGDCLRLLANILNEAVTESGKQTGKAMSIAMVALDLHSGEVAYLNAGHTPLLHLSKTGVKVHLTPASPLGFMPHAEHAIKRFELAPGEGLFVYTDGLTDNVGQGGKKLSMRAIRRILDQVRSPEQAKEQILANCRLTWQGKGARDDCSFIHLRWQWQQSHDGQDLGGVG